MVTVQIMGLPYGLRIIINIANKYFLNHMHINNYACMKFATFAPHNTNKILAPETHSTIANNTCMASLRHNLFEIDEDGIKNLNFTEGR